MAVEGTLDLFKLPEILQLISQQKKTGILTVQGQQDIVAISFLNWVKNAPMFAGSKICHNQSTARPCP